jgi:hypothetical protein
VCKPNIVLQLAPGVTFGIQKLDIDGQVSLVFRPLMKSMPIVGGMQITMLTPPNISWDFQGIGNIIDISAISDIVRSVVMDLITEQLVLPNRLFIHWVQGRENEIDITSMQFPEPEGILRLGIVEARSLDAKDYNLFSKASSDPYATVRIGNRSHKTGVKKKCLAPVWGDDGWFDFFIFNPKQMIRLEVYDKDMVPGGDDFIGRLENEDGTSISIQEVLAHNDVWLPIYSDVEPSKKDKAKASNDTGKKGKVKHKAGEVRLVCNVYDLKPWKSLIAQPPPPKGAANSQAFLMVHVRCLRGLSNKNAEGAVLHIQVGKQKFKTKPSVFSEAMQDFVYDTTTQPIDPAAQRLAEYLADHSQREIDLLTTLLCQS